MSYSAEDLRKLRVYPQLLAYFMHPTSRNDKRWFTEDGAFVTHVVGEFPYDPDMEITARSLYLDMIPGSSGIVASEMFSALFHPTRNSDHSRLFGMSDFSAFLGKWVSTDSRMWNYYKINLMAGLKHVLVLRDDLAYYLDVCGRKGHFSFDLVTDPFLLPSMKQEEARHGILTVKGQNTREDSLRNMRRNDVRVTLKNYQAFFCSKPIPLRPDQIYQDLGVMGLTPLEIDDMSYSMDVIKGINSISAWKEMRKGKTLEKIIEDGDAEYEGMPILVNYGDDWMITYQRQNTVVSAHNDVEGVLVSLHQGKVDLSVPFSVVKKISTDDEDLDELVLCLQEFPEEIKEKLLSFTFKAKVGKKVDKDRRDSPFVPRFFDSPGINLQTIVLSQDELVYQIVEFSVMNEFLYFFLPDSALSLTWILSDGPNINVTNITPVTLDFQVVHSNDDDKILHECETRK